MSDLLSLTLVSLADLLIQRNKTLATAESCTGGGIGENLTSLAGSSKWYLGGVIAYSNAVKVNVLGVSTNTLCEFGAVSEEVAKEMALGCAELSQADIAVSTTGIAGPGGGTDSKPVGMVCFGYFLEGAVFTETLHFEGSRQEVRQAAVEHSLTKLLDLIKSR